MQAFKRVQTGKKTIYIESFDFQTMFSDEKNMDNIYGNLLC